MIASVYVIEQTYAKTMISGEPSCLLIVRTLVLLSGRAQEGFTGKWLKGRGSQWNGFVKSTACHVLLTGDE